MKCRGADTGSEDEKAPLSEDDPASAPQHFVPQRVRDDILQVAF